MTSEGSDVILTVRLIRSFEHRNIKHVVLHNIDLDIGVEEFLEMVRNEVKTKPGIPPPFRKFEFDTMKIQHKAYGAKSSDPVIVREDDEKLMLKPGQSLRDSGVEHETEISCFKLDEYRKYQANPHLVW